MALILTDLASARIRVWVVCGWCGRRVAVDAELLARAHGARPLADAVRRMRCGHCGRQEAGLVMLTGPRMPGDPRMHSPVFDVEGPLYSIDCWPRQGNYRTIIAGPYLDGVRAAWEASAGYEPQAELTLRHGATIMAKRDGK